MTTPAPKRRERRERQSFRTPDEVVPHYSNTHNNAHNKNASPTHTAQKTAPVETPKKVEHHNNQTHKKHEHHNKHQHENHNHQHENHTQPIDFQYTQAYEMPAADYYSQAQFMGENPYRNSYPQMSVPMAAYQQPVMMMAAPAPAQPDSTQVFGDPEDKTPAEYAPTGAKTNKWQLRYERFLLRQSLATMDCETCPKEVMVEMIKQCQRLDIEMRTSWIHYTNAEAKGVRDPSKHEEDFLRQFFRGLQDGTMEEYRRMKNPHRGETANEVFVGGIGVIAHDRVMAYFREFGDLRYVDVKKDKGFGFVKFDDKDAMAKVLAKEEHVIEGKRVEVKPAENRTPKVKKSVPNPSNSALFNQANRLSGSHYGRESMNYVDDFGRESVMPVDTRMSAAMTAGGAIPDGRMSGGTSMYMMQQPAPAAVQYAWVPVQIPANNMYATAYQQPMHQ